MSEYVAEITQKKKKNVAELYHCRFMRLMQVGNLDITMYGYIDVPTEVMQYSMHECCELEP